MRLRSALLTVLAATLVAGRAAAVEIMPVSEVRAGMEGYGLSVFQGTKIERFKVKVVGVLRNAFPKMDMILIRCSGANLEHTGVIAGMSGSPIYIEDNGKARLIGALAYGWMFAKDPIAGVTPIQNMLDEAKRPLRERLARLGNLLAHPHLKPAATPLFASGMVGPLLEAVTPELERWNFVPLQGGGAAPDSARSEKVDLEPGSALGVQLMRGDLELTGVGTVTYRDGDTVLAFGHPMLGIGELRFPVVTAYVQTVFAGLARSFKMASAIAPAGTLVQDRRPGVIAKLGPTAPMIPMQVEVHNSMARRRDRFRMEVVHHRQFTPILVFIGMLNSVLTAASDNTDVSFEATLRLWLAGRPPIELRDHLFSPTGVLGFGLFASPVFRALNQLYANPFEELRPERIEYSLDLLFKRDLARIEGVRFDTDALRPGEKARAIVRLRPYLGRPIDRHVEFDVPRSLEGQTVGLFFAGGAQAPVDVAPPDGLDDLVGNLRTRHPAKSVVVTFQVPTQGLKMRGRNLTDLPRTIVDALSPANAAGLGMVSTGIRQIVVPTDHVIVGGQQIQVRVKRLDE
jgi:hypothetical protein